MPKKDINFYGILYDRTMEFEVKRQYTKRKKIKREIAAQRQVAFVQYGCGCDSERCKFPECFCYPFWEKKYRNYFNSMENVE